VRSYLPSSTGRGTPALSWSSTNVYSVRGRLAPIAETPLKRPGGTVVVRPSEQSEMEVTHQAAWRTAKWSLASLSLLVSLHCNVYDTSLLGNGQSRGGVGAVSYSGASGTTGGTNAASGTGGESEGGSGTAGAGFGGLIGMAGSNEAGGAEAGSGAAGTPDGIAGVGGTTGGNGNAIGGAGTAGVSGAGGVVQTASGCAKLSVTFDDAGDKAHYVVSLNSPADLSGATISMRVYVQAGQGGTIFNYVQDSGTYRFLGVPTAQRHLLSSLSGWSTITWDVGAEPDLAATGIAKASIKNIGIELNALPSSSWSSPTIVYVDSITVKTPTLSFTLGATATVHPTPTATNAPGEALWLNSGATDTTATNVALSWQPTCP
jgi:hypothetical protein